MGPFSSKGMQDLIKEINNLSKTIVEPSTEYWDKLINTEYLLYKQPQLKVLSLMFAKLCKKTNEKEI